jgi:hypothetical protein
MHRKNLSFGLIGSFLASLTALLAGCGGSHPMSTAPGTPGSPGSSTAPTFSVASSMPASGATNVALTATIQIAFSSAANASTVNTTDIVVTDPSGAVSGSVSYNASSNTATFTPSGPLAGSTTYTVKVSGVTGSSGGAMASADSFTFTTAAPAQAPLQYQVSLSGTSGIVGQVSVDTAGNVTVQLKGAVASQTFPVQFCELVPVGQTSATCFAVGTVTTDASGNGTTTVMFPQSGPWTGDFGLAANGTSYSTVLPSATGSSGVYMSTLQPTKTADGGIFNAQINNAPQAPLTSGTITFSTSPAPNGSLQFVLTGGPANDPSIEVAEGGLFPYDYYGVGGSYATNGSGDVTFTAAPSGMGGDIFDVSPQNGDAGWEGGFSVP